MNVLKVFVLWGIVSLWPAWAVAQDSVSLPGAARGSVSTTGSDQTPDTWEVQSVRELMRRDLRDAIGVPSVSESLARANQPPSGPRLVALYGVGRSLMAEVQAGGRAYLYVRGQVFPAGYRGDQTVYQLRGMNGSCIQLERNDERHSLCLRMLLGDQP